MTSVDIQRPLLTIREAAKRLGVSESTIRRRVADGNVVAVRLGNSDRHPLRIPLDQLEAWLYSEEAAA